MSSPIDLCTTSDVRSYLEIVSGLPANSSQTNEVATSIALPITAGNNVVVTPDSMANIFVGMLIGVGAGANLELVSVSAVTGTTFTASFAKSHPAVTPVLDYTNVVIGKLITSASNYWLWATGKGGGGGTPAVSPFVQVVEFDEWYDGNGNSRLFLKQAPIVSVSLLQVSGVTVPLSTDYNVPGYVIDVSGKCLAIRQCGPGRGYSSGQYGFGSRGGWGGGYCFANGVQNIHTQYSSGYSGVPPDVADACTEMVALNFQRRRYLDQLQNTQAQAVGSISYSKLEVTPHIRSVMDNYSRTAFA